MFGVSSKYFSLILDKNPNSTLVKKIVWALKISSKTKILKDWNLLKMEWYIINEKKKYHFLQKKGP